MGAYLAFKELWRNKGRFLLVSMVIALITMLVLFVAGLAEGLGLGNIEYLSKLNADLLVYQKDTELSIAASRIGLSRLNDIRRVDGVKAVGPLAFHRVTIVFGPAMLGITRRPLDVTMIRVEPGQPGEPPVVSGEQLKNTRGKEAIIDRNVALRTGFGVGDVFTVKVIQGAKEQFYPLKVVGVTDGRQYSIQPSIIVPYLTGEEIRPKSEAEFGPRADLDCNVVAVQLVNPSERNLMKQRLKTLVSGIEAVDIPTAYQATPGYAAQQGTLNTQRYFALLIGVLVLGGFFQIQTLQKVPQIGVLKAIGVSNLTIASASILQIVMVTCLGVFMGGALTLVLSLALPPVVPISFSGSAVGLALGSLLVIGPLGGLVSVRYSLRVEPLVALGLNQ